MIHQDQAMGEELSADGSLYEGYHPRMEEVHKRNATRLQEIIRTHGWPGKSVVNRDGVEAAWRIVQHAIGNPALQRECLILLKDAILKGEAEPWQAAMLEDRIRSLEGRFQIYGTQFDWDEHGELSPYPPIEDLEHLEERRQKVGLRPLAEEIRIKRKEVADSKERPPHDLAERRKKMDDWARSVGWR